MKQMELLVCDLKDRLHASETLNDVLRKQIEDKNVENNAKRARKASTALGGETETPINNVDKSANDKPGTKPLGAGDRVKRPLIRGTKTSSTCSLGVKRPPPVKKLFVSNIRPDATPKDINDHFLGNNLTVIKMFKLQTKNERYSSFCVFLNDNDFGIANQSDFRDSDVRFKEYYGYPHEDQVIEVYPAPPSDGEDGMDS